MVDWTKVNWISTPLFYPKVVTYLHFYRLAIYLE